jgi:hypothetical protein
MNTALVPIDLELPISTDGDRWRARWDPATKRAQIALSESAAAQLAPILELVETAQAFEVRTPEERAMIVEWVREFPLRLEEALGEVFGTVTALANGLHKGLTTARSEYADLITLAKSTAAEKVGAYDDRVEAERLEAERRVREEREATERQRALEAGQAVFWTVAAYVAKCTVEDEARWAAAKTADEAGDKDAAEMIRAQVGRHEPEPQLPLAPRPPPAPPAPRELEREGTARRSNWKAELVDKPALIAWVAQDIKARGHFLELDQAAADRAAKDHEDRLAEVIPGLRAVDKGRLGFRRS